MVLRMRPRPAFWDGRRLWAIYEAAIGRSTIVGMTDVDIGTTQLFVEEVGNGPLALVMHGGLGLDHTYLTPWLDGLGARRRLAYYDHRGCGRSAEVPADTITMTQLADDADRLREALGGGRVTVIGHSYGGFVALQYAATYPDCVDHLILLDTAPAGDYLDELDTYARAHGATEEMLSGEEPATDEEFAASFRRVAPLYFVEWDEALFDQMFKATRYRRAAGVASSEEWARWSAVSQLAHVTAPTLVVVGSDDWITPPAQAKRIAEGIPGSTLHLVPTAGHFPWIEDPSLVPRLCDFLA